MLVAGARNRRRGAWRRWNIGLDVFLNKTRTNFFGDPLPHTRAPTSEIHCKLAFLFFFFFFFFCFYAQARIQGRSPLDNFDPLCFLIAVDMVVVRKPPLP
jgi:hypothetical protein